MFFLFIKCPEIYTIELTVIRQLMKNDGAKYLNSID
jgi:hypothetical protein